MTVSGTKLLKRGHLKPLDGVRGLAVLMVVFSHAFESDYGSAKSVVVRLLGQIFYFGFFGVDLFFVLSGFLISGILYDSLDDPGYFRKFYARRALRIFPLYYGLLGLLFALTPILHLQWKHMGLLFIFYLQNFEPRKIMTFSLAPAVPLYHFWSLAIEEQFYLIWPAVVFAIRDKRRLLMTTLIGSVGALLLRLVLLANGVSGFTIHATTLTRADSLLLGGTAALLYRSRHWIRVQQWAPVGFLAATVVITSSILMIEPWLAPHKMLLSLWYSGVRYSILAIGFCCLLAWSLTPRTYCRWFFERRWLCFLGKYSYGIYMLHVLIFGAMLLPLRRLMNDLTGSKLISVAVSGCASIIVAILAAYLSFNLFEKQFLRLKHRFDYLQTASDQPSSDGLAKA
jgi:peptidoglycan/LPS O-acetylase OafA/YrhL